MIIARDFLNFDSLNPSKIFSFFRIEIEFRIRFTNNGKTKSNAPFDKAVSGVIALFVKVIIGASAARTINANASAPPNIPVLQRNIANGAMINEIRIDVADSEKLGSKTNKTTENAPNPIHKTS